MKLNPLDLEKITSLTLDHYDQRAEEFWHCRNGLPGGCLSQSALTVIQGARISISSPLLDGYDEPEILRFSSR
jgi:hypothetical protein